MANCKLVFIGDGVEENLMELQCFCNAKGQVYIEIRDSSTYDGFEFICLDKSTAIKFSKALRTAISQIEE